ncbi:RAMP superfamily protein [Sporotomaculum syntrophicum]|uniref:RAMP superfamily protein n=1 Tax=Sporotomaculum syntrophicum TaxID=182264 RepID=A0A9D2WS99_9FIRM|nr:RAMP superfamily CRISPR-associated protein [Sporotomaculum syntrophicum]KAF1086195.1 RAMP superfamily protein [Sporotomaculum syntrophicum]
MMPQRTPVPENDYVTFVSYAIPAGEAVRAANFRELLTFFKDDKGRPDIPGSCVKGAVRTALVAQLMKNSQCGSISNLIFNNLPICQP